YAAYPPNCSENLDAAIVQKIFRHVRYPSGTRGENFSFRPVYTELFGGRSEIICKAACRVINFFSDITKKFEI
ncbi:MAG: hypothetical protein IJT57_04900, partial [Selenomonadaceae bacterium]|nr:hypothetical protein [Selenomonadaceae bacterium]